MFDTHIHTNFSSDSEMNIDIAIKKARELNLGLTITDHMDLNYPDKTKFKLDIDSYFNDYINYKSNNLLLGIELGMDENFSDENLNIAKKYNFDQIIGSQHSVNGIDIFDKSLYKGKSKDYIFTTYFTDMIASINTHNYIDILAHIDYICRYCTFEDKEMHVSEYGDYIKEVFKLCIENNIVVELNTRRFNDDKAIKSLKDIYSIYTSLGGTLVTIGSDSHVPENIGRSFKEAVDFCDVLNLKPVHFKNRKIEYEKI
ncbi:histidinol phosphate phosphatase [Clostridium senegalense]|uniref:histidinol phosphate phosphatase n=1 Tax=Clostridium senegalense TaxID=1465809 RepID=UPI000288E41B|nr:histidinol phosphate phosphatase [Clostridium senegalense]